MDDLDKHGTLPGQLRTYSVAAVVYQAHVSKIFDGLWKTVKMFSLEQDSQVIDDDRSHRGRCSWVEPWSTTGRWRSRSSC